MTEISLFKSFITKSAFGITVIRNSLTASSHENLMLWKFAGISDNFMSDAREIQTAKSSTESTIISYTQHFILPQKKSIRDT